MNLLAKPAYAQEVSIRSNFAYGYLDNFGYAISFLIPVAFALAGIFVVFHFLIAAYEMIMSQGDKNTVAQAKERIYHSLVGFILLIFLFLAIQYLPEALLGTTTFKIIK